MSKNGVEISVIIPVFNIENELKFCLDSLVAQTYSDFEVIVVDDGSTDGCAKVIELFATKDIRFKVFRKENGGLARARIDGVRLATGRYVFHLDGDDFLPLNALEKLHKLARISKAEIIGGSHERYLSGSSETIHFKGRERIDCAEFIRIMYTENYFYVWGKLIKRDICQPFPPGIEGISYGEDTVLMTELALRAKVISFVEDVVYVYRIRENSLSNRPTATAVESRLRAATMACRNVRGSAVGSITSDEVRLYFLTQMYRHFMDGGAVRGSAKIEMHSEIVESMKGVVGAAVRKKNWKMFLVLQTLKLNINLFYILGLARMLVNCGRRMKQRMG